MLLKREREKREGKKKERGNEKKKGKFFFI
jgi:hypothetical protein